MGENGKRLFHFCRRGGPAKGQPDLANGRSGGIAHGEQGGRRGTFAAVTGRARRDRQSRHIAGQHHILPFRDTGDWYTVVT